jgi:alpha-ketoglutarate-dependent taurine dioxygenase
MHNEVEEDEKPRNTAAYSKKSTARFNSESDHSNGKNSPKHSRSSRNSKNSEAFDKDKGTFKNPVIKLQTVDNEPDGGEGDPIKIEEGQEDRAVGTEKNLRQELRMKMNTCSRDPCPTTSCASLRTGYLPLTSRKVFRMAQLLRATRSNKSSSKFKVKTLQKSL